MTPEMEQAYRDAAIPFRTLGGVDAQGNPKRSWRYFLEVNSACSLHCITCTKGNQEGYDHLNGIMDWDLMCKCLDKIKSENPDAIVFLYGNSEPFLHPKLPEVIAEVKARGLRCEFSTNLNSVRRTDEVLAAKPDFIIISVSGFTQEIYERGHCGGKIDKVKLNMHKLSEANVENCIPISVNYHVYNYNGHELEPMRELAKHFGFGLFTSYARVISMENAIQICREEDPEKQPFEVQEGRPDWNSALPPTSQAFRDIVKELKIPPQKSRELYKDIPVRPVCAIADLFTFIRHTGESSLCACVADRRINVGSYLDQTAEQLSEAKRGHSVCQQCQKYKLAYYFHVVGWTPNQVP